MDDRRTTPGAPSLRDDHDRRRGLLWPLLALLALLLVAAVLVATLGGDDEGGGDRAAAPQTTTSPSGGSAGGGAGTDDSGTGTDDSGAGTAGSGSGGAAAGEDGSGSGSGSGSGGELTAGGQALLPPPAGTDPGFVGETAQGRDLGVLSVTDNGFFVGSGPRERVYVELGGDVGEDEGEPRPEEGDRVDLTGPVRPAPEDPAATLKLNEEDARLVQQQGFFVNAEEVTVR